MVNIIRRYKDVLMIVVTLMVIVTFSLWGPNVNPRSGRDQPEAVIHGKPVSNESWKREIRRMTVHAGMRQSTYLRALDPGFMMGKISHVGIENSLLFDIEADALGITVTPEERQSQLDRSFRGIDGKFDPASYDAFLQNSLQPQGFSKAEIDIFLDREVRVMKVAELIGSVVPPTSNDVKQQFLRESLTTEASYVVVKSDDLGKDLKVTDEEIRKRYEANKEFLKLPEKRKVRFAAFVLPPTAEGKQMDTSKRTEALQKLADAAYDFASALAQPGANFDEMAKNAKVKIGETAEFFARDAGPAEIEKSTVVAEKAFELTKEKPYSTHISLKDGTYVLALKEIKAPEQMDFEKARAQLETELKEEKLDAALRKAAETTRGKLVDARKSGKSFAEAATAAGLKAELFPAFSAKKQPPPNATHGQIIQDAARKLGPGDISDVIVDSGVAIIIHVDHRSATDEKGLEEAKPRIAAGIQGWRMQAAFPAWIADRRKAAGLPDTGPR